MFENKYWEVTILGFILKFRINTDIQRWKVNYTFS